MRWLRLLVPMALPAAWIAGLATPVSAEPIDRCSDPANAPDWCLDQEELPDPPPPLTPGRGNSSNDNDRDDRDEDDSCGWELYGDDPSGQGGGRTGYPVTPTLANGQPPEGEEVVWYAWCLSEYTGDAYRGPYMWVAAGEPVTPETVAEGLYEQIQGRMPDPVVVTSPPVGTDAVINVPVFFTVENWRDELVEVDQLGGATVSVTAAPDLVLDAGDGTGAVSCAGPGRRYEEGAGDLWVQAEASDACTHTYALRTGVEGRPVVWPGVVTVRWSISWSATTGESGTFDDVERTVAVSRGVREVQAVVTGGS